MRSCKSFGAAVGIVAALVVTGCDVAPREVKTMTRSVELDQAESVDVEIKMGAGELNVGGGAGKLLDADFRFNVPTWEPVVDYQSGARARLRIEQPNTSSAFRNTQNNWTLKFNDRAALDLVARLGAGEATLKLGTLNLRSLEIHEGAGELKLDLTGTPKHSYDVRVNGGVGTARIRVPRSVAIVANATGGLGSVNVQGLEKRGSSWYNAGHENDPVTIRLDVKGGIGEISISAE